MATSHLFDRTESPRYLALAEALHGRIVRGEYEVGSRLPTERALASEFGMAIMTVRHGVGLLVEKGLVKRHQGLGTFVVGLPQTVANIALLCGDSLTIESAHFYRAILNRLRTGSEERRWKLRVYDQLNPSLFGQETVDKQTRTLLEDHRMSPFGGAIAMVPGSAKALPEAWQGKIPFALMEQMFPQSDILWDGEHFGHQAVQCLAGMGRRRLFFFCTHWVGSRIPESVAAIEAECQRLGLPKPQIERMEVDAQGYEMENRFYRTFQQTVEQWRRSGDLPDGVIFGDDIALRSAMPAILQAGYEVPKDFSLLCYGNEDVRFSYGVPVARFEISPAKIASHLLEVVDCRMKGTQAPSPLSVEGRLFLEQ